MPEGPYYLARRVMGQPFRLPIPQARFAALKSAWENLGHATRVEEEWESVLQNYLDLEKELLDAASRSMVGQDHDIFGFQDARIRFATRLSNLLSSCRSYLDHTPHHLNQIVPKFDGAAAFRALASAEYDSRFGYRFMEALRTHAQHRGLPIHGTSYSSSWVEGGEEGLISYSVRTKVDLEILRKDTKFKIAVLKDVSASELEAEPLVRDYIEGLSLVHVATRELLAGLLDDWKAEIRKAIYEFASVAPEGEVLGLAAFELEEPYSWRQWVPLSEHFVAIIERYQRRNGALVNFAKRFVMSGQKLKSKEFR